MDIEIRRFRKALINLINQTQLPIEVKRLVTADVLMELTKAADDFVMGLLQQQQAEEEARRQQAEQKPAEIVDFEPQKEEKENGPIT